MLFALGCGGTAAPPSSIPASPGGVDDAPAAKNAAPPASAAGSEPALAEEEEDPRTLVPLFSGTNHPSFPRASASEATCWREMGLSGDAQRDYDALVARCGTPTGALEYAKPAVGSLHDAKDRRDTFKVHVAGGLCYRVFGVADATIKDLDVLIEHAGGALVGDDKTNGPVAIIDGDRAWCFDADGDYEFLVQVDGTGAGHYRFGIWARPAKAR